LKHILINILDYQKKLAGLKSNLEGGMANMVFERAKAGLSKFGF